MIGVLVGVMYPSEHYNVHDVGCQICLIRNHMLGCYLYPVGNLYLHGSLFKKRNNERVITSFWNCLLLSNSSLGLDRLLHWSTSIRKPTEMEILAALCFAQQSSIYCLEIHSNIRGNIKKTMMLKQWRGNLYTTKRFSTHLRHFN